MTHLINNLVACWYILQPVLQVHKLTFEWIPALYDSSVWTLWSLCIFFCVSLPLTVFVLSCHGSVYLGMAILVSHSNISTFKWIVIKFLCGYQCSPEDEDYYFGYSLTSADQSFHFACEIPLHVHDWLAPSSLSRTLGLALLSKS